MSYLHFRLTCLALFALPLILSAQFSDVHPVAWATDDKLSLSYSDIDGDGALDLVIGAVKGVFWVPGALDGSGFYAPRRISTLGGIATVGDMDQDGDPDVAYNHWYGTGKYDWYRNDGQGNFELVKNWGAPCSDFPAIHMADMDLDGNLDFVGTDYLQSACYISWYKNLDGAGTLADPSPIKKISNCKWIQPLDVDSDGDVDMVYNNSSRTYWAENIDGLGTAWGPDIELSNQKASAAAMADIDGDGLKDLVLTLFGPGLVWYKRTANGFNALTYLLQGVVNTTGDNQYLCVGDPDQDGDTDVFGASPNKLIFYRNNGSGSFQHTVLDESLDIVGGLVLADFNSDGKSDLVAFNKDPEKVRWYANLGGANYGPAQAVHTDFALTASLAVADLDLDGDLDVVAGNLAHDGSVDPAIKQLAWYENQDGHFIRQHIVAYDWAEFAKVKIADIDGDNDPDIVAGGGSPQRVCWFENNGAGQFDSIHTLYSSSFTSLAPEIVVSDIDADGDMDVSMAYSTSSKIFWFENMDGKGTFSALKPVTSVTDVSGMEYLDMNNDQVPDLVAISDPASGTYLYLFYADSAGYFKSSYSFNFGEVTKRVALKTGDLDGDGKKDLVAAGKDAGLWVFRSKSSFIKSIVGASDNVFKGEIAIVDVDLDGDNDLVVSGLGSTQDIVWYENADGLGNFKPSSLAYSPSQANAFTTYIGCGDLDGDADPDIVFSTYDTQREINWVENEIAGSRTISGRSFWDVNGNTQPDSVEAGLQSQKISISPLPKATYSNENGEFRFYVPPGVYDLSFEPELCQKLTTPVTLIANTIDASVDSLYFGIQYNPDSSGLRGWVFGERTRCGQKTRFKLVLENTGCVAESGTVSMRINDLATISSAFPAPLIITPDSVIWEFSAIPPGNTYQIDFFLKIAGADHAGDSVRVHLQPYSTTGGIFTQRKPFDYATVIRCSFDPNDKQVWPARGGNNPVFDNEEVMYTIRFQNTGNDTAYQVILRDQLAPELDWSTLRPLAASHPYLTILNEDGMLEFQFKSISLPDSATDQMGSQGFVSFLIRLKSGVPLNTIIENTANIFFDENLPVATNTVPVWRHDPTSASETPFEAEQAIRIYPNPFSERLYFQWNSHPDATPMRFELWDMTQRLSRSIPLPDGPSGTLTVPSLQSGFYLYRIVRERDGVVLSNGKIIRM